MDDEQDKAYVIQDDQTIPLLPGTACWMKQSRYCFWVNTEISISDLKNRIEAELGSFKTLSENCGLYGTCWPLGTQQQQTAFIHALLRAQKTGVLATHPLPPVSAERFKAAIRKARMYKVYGMGAVYPDNMAGYK